MRRLVIASTLVLLLGACRDDGSDGATATTAEPAATTTSTTSATGPAATTATSSPTTTATAGPPGDAAGDVLLSALDGATTPGSFTLVVDDPGATAATLIVDGGFVAKLERPPLAFAVSFPPGEHEARVRIDVDDDDDDDDDERSTRATFTVVEGPALAASTPTTAPPATSAPPTTAAGPTTTLGPPQPGDTVVDTVDEIRVALASARPGDVIRVADGEYTFKPRLVASASGTPTAPITLRGTRNAIIRTKNASGDYGLHITGDHWNIQGITVAHATKGIVLDGSLGTTIDGVEVHDIGDEAIHFRTCSSDGVLRGSYIHDTGRNSAQYGEGVYVGSANSNWSQYQCTDPIEGQTQGDNTERVLIEDNTFEDITAEGADLKEGTDSGTLRRNTFRRTGTSGQNSADSAVDAKGNGWLIEDNTVSETDAPWDDDGVPTPSKFTDGYQTHTVYTGYGTRNTFRRNHVTGTIPGYGIGLYPANTNTVTCDNTAPNATKGLVGDNGHPIGCTP